MRRPLLARFLGAARVMGQNVLGDNGALRLALSIITALGTLFVAGTFAMGFYIIGHLSNLEGSMTSLTNSIGPRLDRDEKQIDNINNRLDNQRSGP